ncbi:MAG: hypothetical protein HOV87_11580 [Catenulispora sp.]|nr:hypothetical protein [Catenulispora sp.]
MSDTVGDRTRTGASAPAESWRRRLAPVAFLAVAAPICAEYLVGYDDSIGDPAALIFGLFVFVPVYGAPAILIREIVRRPGRGWPSIFLLAAAFGVLQAALLDQSLFNPHYRDISYWDHLWQPTLLPGGWTSAAMILGFVGGHIVGSISAPIALTEAMFPDRAREPWLRPPALVGLAALWAAGAWAVLADSLDHEAFRPSAAQVLVTLVVVIVLIAAALAIPRRHRALRQGRTPSPAVVLGVSLVALAVRPLLDSLEVGSRSAGAWPATIGGLLVLVAFAILLTRWSSAPGWGPRHILAVASGALIAIAVVAFTVRPIGHVPTAAKFTTNSVLFLLLLAVLAAAERRQRAAVE